MHSFMAGDLGVRGKDVDVFFVFHSERMLKDNSCTGKGIQKIMKRFCFGFSPSEGNMYVS